MLEATGLDASCCPRSSSRLRCVRTCLARRRPLTGLAPGTPIVAGAGDQAAGAVGMGITRPGAVSATIGTSGVVFAATERPALDPQGTHPHVLSRDPGPLARHGRHAGGRVCRCAGCAISIGAAVDRPGDTPDAAYDRLVEAASQVPPGSDGVLWAPYLMGERTPHCDPDVRAALVGLAAEPHARARRSRGPGRRRVQPARHVLDLRRARRAGRERARSAAAARARRCGGRSRPTFTAGRSRRWRPRKAPPTAPRFWPASAPASGQRWTRRATPSCAPPAEPIRTQAPPP